MKILKALGPFFIQVLICGIFLEVFSYFFLMYSGNPLYRARRILHYDQTLGWMQRPHLSTTFDGSRVSTDENGFRIGKQEKAKLLTLGPSSAFGWGVEHEESYSSLLGAFNASGIGHTIYQGKIMWEQKLQDQRPTHVLIAYGVNDLDKFRFYDSDSTPDEEYFSSPRASALDEADLSSNFVNVLSLAFNLAKYQMKCDQIANASQRVSWEKYQEILLHLVQDMKAKNIVPVLVNTPFYLAKPRADFTSEQIRNAYQKASDFAKKGECKNAHNALREAKALEPDNILSEVKVFNQHLEQFAREQGLIYIDAFKTISVEDPAANFVDPVHPSALGHQKIAGQIRKAMFN